MRVAHAWRSSVGPWSPNMIRRIAEVINAPAKRDESHSSASTPVAFMARITGASLQSSETYVWAYTWEEVLFSNTGTVVTDYEGRRKSSHTATWGNAYNGCEGPQLIGGNTTLGPGITLANIPAGFTLARICNNTIVMMHRMRRQNGQPLYFFSCPNPIDGTCE